MDILVQKLVAMILETCTCITLTFDYSNILSFPALLLLGA